MTTEPTTPLPTIQDRINYAATENNALLKTLSETEYAPAAVQQNSSHITTLTQKIRDKEKQVQTLSLARMKGQSQHEKYQDSTMRRLAYRMTGKKSEFEQKAARGEREYFETVQAQFKSTRSLEALQKSLKEAQQTRQEIEGALARNQAAREELDRLYASIFDGPTPEFPEEDVAEQEVVNLKQAYNDARIKLSNESQVQRILENAEQFIGVALRNLIVAKNASRMDVWGSGGLFGDITERSALAKGRAAMYQAAGLVDQARGLSTNIAEMEMIWIDGREFMGNMLLNDMIPEYAFYQIIQQGSAQVGAAGERLRGEIERAKREVCYWRAEVSQKGKRLAKARERLQRIRRNAFDSVAGGLPEYQL